MVDTTKYIEAKQMVRERERIGCISGWTLTVAVRTQAENGGSLWNMFDGFRLSL